MSRPVTPVSQELIDGILAYLPVFEQRGYRFGDWTVMGGHIPYFSYNPQVQDFLALLSGGFLLSGDWTAWKDEAQRVMAEPERLAGANLLTLRRLLTVHVRAERFNEGHLATAFQRGHITAILRRLKEIQAGL